MSIRFEPILKFLCKYWFTTSLILIFSLLVSFGITGSSLGFYKKLPGCKELVSFSGERKLFGSYMGIRSDEFIAHGTATAIQQYHHEPKFPRLNTNCGLEGRDYLVLHDTGAPVKHFSMIGRPAVWGFFFLDLRHALSWYWFIPIFLALWGGKFFLDRLFPGQEVVNAILSCSLTFSAYAGAWSFWPVNNVYGLFIAGGAILEIMRTPKWRYKFAWAFVAGWMFYCAFMSLYMPRVIPALYLVLIVLLVYFYQNKLLKELLKVKNILPLLTVVIIFGALAVLWFIDARPVIERILSSAYPGTRRHPGGDMPWWMFFMGYFSLLTSYRTDFLNQCELQSFFNILPLVLTWFILKFRDLKFRAMWWALFGFTAVICIYQMIGFPKWLAEITFLSRTIPTRCLWVFNILQMVMLALYWQENKESELSLSRRWIRCISFAMLIYACVAAAVMPLKFYRGMSVSMASIFYLVVAVILIFWVSGKFIFVKPWVFILIYTVASIVPGILFNPVGVAPEKIENCVVSAEEAKQMPFKGRMLFATDNDFLAVAYSLCGGKVFNGYFMYYDAEIDELLFKDQFDRQNFHRMNHLDIKLGDLDAPAFSASAPFPDRIEVVLNGAGYDFSQLPIDIVCTYNSNLHKLEQNPSLHFLKSGRFLCFFEVVRKK